MKLNNPSRIRRTRSESGITVVEFLVGVAALGVILVLTVPNISPMIQSHYLDSTISAIALSMNLAQSEAERRRITVRICPSSDRASCHQDSDWSKGWLVYSDSNSDGMPQTIELIRAYGPPGRNIRINASGAFSDSLAFTFAGLTSSQLLKSGEFSVCNRKSGARSSLKVVVNGEGEVRLVKDDGMNCSG